MNIITHAVKQPFVLATGVAALVHSTWALGTLFAGEQPADIPHLVGWLVPAFLIAFALDVGQIITSAEIRASGLSWQRAVTFTTFAAATYYLQWLYIAHHMPALTLAAGVRPEWSGLTGLIRDAALWAIPALLPLSTLLYTLSSSEPASRPTEAVLPGSEQLKPITIQTEEKSLPATIATNEQAAPGEKTTESQVHIECEACGWHGSYSQPASARAALRAHRRHCTVLNEKVELENENHA